MSDYRVGRLIELGQSVAHWQRLHNEGRCPRNTGLKVDHCHLCQNDEPGHGTGVVDQQLSRAREELAALRQELPKVEDSMLVPQPRTTCFFLFRRLRYSVERSSTGPFFIQLVI